MVARRSHASAPYADSDATADGTAVDTAEPAASPTGPTDPPERGLLDELSASEARFRATFEAAGIGLAHVGLDGRWLLVNDRLCAITGFDRADLLRKTIRDVTHPDDIAAALAQLDRLRNGEMDRYQVEKRYVRADGTRIWVSATATLVRDADGRPSYIVAAVEDVSERRAAEAALRASEERLRRAQHAARVGTWDLDLGTGEVAWSEGVFELAGLPPEAGLPTAEAWDALLHPDDRAQVARRLQAAIDSGEPYENEFRLVRPSGEVVWVAAQGQALYDEAGRAVRFLGVNFNITARKAAEAAARDREQAFRHLVDAMPHLAWIARPDGEIDYCNERARLYDGYRQRDDGTWQWLGAVHPDDVDRTFETWWLGVEQGRPYEIEHRLRLTDGGYRWHLSRSVPARGESGRVLRWYGTATDVHEMKEAEALLHRLNDTLEGRVAERTAELERVNEELRRARDHFRTAFHASPIAASITRLHDGHLFDVNEECARFFGLERDTLLGRSAAELGVGAFPHEQAWFTDAMRTEGRVRNREFAICAATGEQRTALASVEVLDLDGEPYAFSMFVDVTEWKRAEERVRELASALALAEQRERRRISGILHDDLQQLLVAAQMRVAPLARRAPDAQAADDLLGLLDRAVEVTRTLSLELNPPVLDGEGLADTLRWLARHVETAHGLRVELDLDEHATLAGRDLRVLAVQIVRELLFNVVKHAGVGAARLSTHRIGGPAGGRVCVVVADEGRGFDVAALDARAHRASLGLFSVEERLRLVGGRLRIDAAPGAGTRVTVELSGEHAPEAR